MLENSLKTLSVFCLGLALHFGITSALAVELSKELNPSSNQIVDNETIVSPLSPNSTDEDNYLLGTGDLLRITVYNNPDLPLETRVGDGGMIRYPLIGEVLVAGISSTAAEKIIANLLETGNFIKQPQVNILVTQYQSKLVSVLGSVLKPGQYPLERATNLSQLLALAGGANSEGSDLVTITTKTGKIELDLKKIIGNAENIDNFPITGGEIVYVHARDVSVIGQVNRPGKYAVTDGVRTLGDFISIAGGISPVGSDTVTLTTIRDGKQERYEVDIDDLFRTGNNSTNIELKSGDTVYVPRAPMVYIYGEVQRPGTFRIERNMTVLQALVQGGGLTPRGTVRNIQLDRRDEKGEIKKMYPKLTDLVMQDDVIYVRESLF
jgi:polysaccharide export outer membrane protein